ncbi:MULTISPECIES: hypothetical protein [unclassified Pseudoalteromonas]|uniref:hypothetical protein n=1 Tax=unclassified Pseudoalteromonas TaxID=194690 RepID=UPI001600DDBA|nr:MULTISPECIES: hypothetical protein [unclassified Pseudoalteromonas]MBB1351238.1 hypothetical protein [Pseudoalteromonas sp. SG45-3]MBB1358660.1 hypothetical protein [Pseudoalteromonas sp. SG45-6]
MSKSKGMSLIEGKDNRLIGACFRILELQGEQLPLNFETPVKGAKIIDQVIASKEATSEEKEKMVQSLIAEAEQSLLSLDEFDWIKDNERACYFLWASIYLNSYAEYPAHPLALQTQEHQPQYIHFYSQHNLKSNPSNSKERFGEVVNYFDRVRQPREWKLNLIAHLKGIWGHIFSSRKPFSWLEKDNEEQCRWAWDYISKIDWDNSKPMISQLSATSTKEMYFAIYAAYDTWNAATEAKRLFTIDFNKAWQQKKHRDSRQGKKACSLVLHEDIKNKLDELAKTRKVTLSQLVEQLIEKEHSSTLKRD